VFVAARQARRIALLGFVRFVLWWVRVKRSPTAGNHFRKVARGAGRFVTWPWQPPMIQTKPTIVELDMDKLEEILRRLEAKQLDADDYETIKAVIGAYVHLFQLVGDKETTIRRLRQMLFGAKTEKTSAVIANLENGGESASPRPSSMVPAEDVPASPAATEAECGVQADAEASVEGDSENDSQASSQTQGHGQNGAAAFTGAEKIEVRHQSLQAGDPCPKCEQGTLYDTGRPGVLVRLVGQAPVKATVYYLQKLRCNPCGAIFTAKPPEGVDPEEKYDPTVGSMIALLKYGYGMPFHRQETLEGNLGIPLSDSTQWDIVAAQAERAEAVWEEVVRQAAQGPGADGRASATSGLGGVRQRHDKRLRRGLRSQGDVHLGDRGDAARRRVPGAQDRVVPQRTPTRRGEPEGRVEAACDGAARADPDVRSPGAEPAWRVGDDRGQLPGPRPAAVRRCGQPVSGRVPACAGGACGGLPQRRHRQRAEPLAAGAIALPPGRERPDHGGTPCLACPSVRPTVGGA